jgi:hypothetical protein
MDEKPDHRKPSLALFLILLAVMLAVLLAEGLFDYVRQRL